MLIPFAAPALPDGFVEYGIDVIPGDDPVWINAQHGEWLRSLSDAYELTWVTGWGEDPNLLCPLLGIDPMPCVPMPPIPFDPELKVPAVELFVGADRAVAWVDDMLGDGAQEWAASRAAPTLLVDVDPSVGLTPVIVGALFEWAGNLRA